MWKNSKEFLKLKSEWIKRGKNQVVDIILFGSLARGKRKPEDIDVCLVFRDKVDLKVVNKTQMTLGSKYHVSSLIVDNFFTKAHSLAKTLLLEGRSLISGKKMAENVGLVAKIIYSYDLSKEKASKKVRFVYLLRGRGEEEGMVKKLKGEFISNSAFMIPVEKDNELREVLEKWRVKYKRKRVMLMS